MNDNNQDDKTLDEEVTGLEKDVEKVEVKKMEKAEKIIKEENLNAQITGNDLENLNQPLKDPAGTDEEDQVFIKKVMQLVDEGKIDLHTPETLLNKEIYDELDEETQSYADVNAINILDKLRQIRQLYEQGFENTFQLKNMINWVRVTKERIETEKGDIYII